MPRLLLVWLVLVVATPVAAPVAAQAVEQQGCNEDYVAAQRTRKEGKLLQAREHLLACSRELCMDVIERDCVTWLQEVDASTPTVVVFARDRWGDETLNVRVLIDGAIVRDVLDANAIAVDPGTHKFRFETTDAAPVEQTVILREGEKNRRVEVKFVESTTGADTERVPMDDGTGLRFELTDLGWALGGAGVVAVVGGTLFFVSAGGTESDFEAANCGATCQRARDDAVDRQRTIGGVMLGVGIASAVAAACLFLWAPGDDDRASTRLHLGVLPGGAFAQMRGTL
jgi:hypothetical protein